MTMMFTLRMRLAKCANEGGSRSCSMYGDMDGWMDGWMDGKMVDWLKGKVVRTGGSSVGASRREWKRSGSQQKRVGAQWELAGERGSTTRILKEKSITGGCAPNGNVQLAEWEHCNWTELEYAFGRLERLTGKRKLENHRIVSYLTLFWGFWWLCARCGGSFQGP